MRTLALYSIKGGVGKTAATVNLAYLAANDGARTLVWDLDPQGSSSFYFRIKARIRGGGKGLLRGKTDLDELIKGTDFDNLDLLPSDFSLRNLDLYLDAKKKPTRQISKILKPLSEEYDYIFLDCPPNISLLSESVFDAANVLVSPIIPTTLSVHTLKQLEKYIEGYASRAPDLLPFFSMVDLRKNLHKQIVESLHQDFPRLLKSQIPYASDIEQMGVQRAPVHQFASKGRAACAFQSLWKELQERLAQR